MENLKIEKFDNLKFKKKTSLGSDSDGGSYLLIF